MKPALALVGILWCSLALAGEGRQTLTTEADFPYRTVRNWVEGHQDQIIEATGAEITDKPGDDLVSLLKVTKYGTQRFVVRQTGGKGVYRLDWVSRQEGGSTGYTCELSLKPLPGRRTEITVTMTGGDENASSIAVNIELRRSLRGIRDYLDKHLKREQ